MNEMVARVCKALEELSMRGGAFPPWSVVAREAINALRDPSQDVLEAGCASHPPGDYHAGTTLADIIGAEWRAMIDKALEQT